MIEIDGSTGEAGGQIVRTAIGLSAVTGRAVRIFNIRKGRPKSGLMAQHLTSVNACAKICDAKVKGAELGSTELTFEPGKIKGGEYKIDVGTAGSISLVLQTLVIPAIHADKKISFDLTGGTHVKWSPDMGYFQEVFCPNLKLFGIEIDSAVLKHGFYPKGGGHVKVDIAPAKLTTASLLNRGKLNRIDVWSTATNDLKKARVAERQLESIEKMLDLTNESKRNVFYVDALSTGSCAHVHAHYENCNIGATVLGEIKKSAEQVGKEAAQELLNEMKSNGCLDKHMADQILPFMALAVDKSESTVSVTEITNHCMTNIWVIEKFLPVKFEISGKLGESGIIKCLIDSDTKM